MVGSPTTRHRTGYPSTYLRSPTGSSGLRWSGTVLSVSMGSNRKRVQPGYRSKRSRDHGSFRYRSTADVDEVRRGSLGGEVLVDGTIDYFRLCLG